MNFIESFKVAIASLLGNKMRSFLTMLGIIIGISSVITIVSLGQGSQAQIGSEFEKIGTNRVVIHMNWEKNPTYRERFDDEDIKMVKRIFSDDIKGISPNLSISGQAKNGRNEKKINVFGVNEEYNKIENIDIIYGRFLLEGDVLGRRKVCIIDKDLAIKLFGRENVLGEKITVDFDFAKTKFSVVGIYERQSSSFDAINSQFGEIPSNIYVPVGTLQLLGLGNRYYAFEINVVDNSKIDSVSEDIIKVIERKHRNEGKDYYKSTSYKSQMQILDNILGIMSKVVGAIAAISLLVGGIGVMNIMLVSVTERTREIGIRKAIGATRRDILIQFLVESVIISGTGGLIGTILGLIFQSLIAMSIGVPPTASIVVILIAVLFSAGVGIFFGIYPANKAAKLDPIDALRYE